MPALPQSILRSAFNIRDANDDARMGAEIAQKAAPVVEAMAAPQMQPVSFQGAVPDLDTLLGELATKRQPAQAQDQPAAPAAQEAQVASPVPSMASLLGGTDVTAAQPDQSRPIPTSSAPYTPPAGSEGVMRWSGLVEEAARTYGIPASTLYGLMEIESGGNEGARSVAGAMGLMQVMCVDEETEALTRRGWLAVDDITPDDELLTYSLTRNRLQWQRQSAPLNRYTVDEVWRLHNQALDFVVTPNHKWVFFRPGDKHEGGRFLAETQVAFNKTPRYLLRAAPYEWPTQSPYSNAFVAILGWVVTDGSVPKAGNGITVVQKKPAHVEKIRELFVAEFPNHLERPHDQGATRWSVCGKDGLRIRAAIGPDKRLTPDFLSSLTWGQASLLLRALLDGDGTVRKRKNRGGPIFYGNRLDRMGDVQILCMMLGAPFNIRTAIKADQVAPGRGAFYSGTVSGRTGTYVPTIRVEKIHEPTPVWCPTLPNGTWVARRNGKVSITGNSFHFQPGEDPFDPRTNVMRGAKIYADALRRWGDPDKAAAAYFGAIDERGNITGATDATGTNGHHYVRLWRAAAAKYGQPQQQAAPAPAQPAPAPRPDWQQTLPQPASAPPPQRDNLPQPSGAGPLPTQTYPGRPALAADGLPAMPPEGPVQYVRTRSPDGGLHTWRAAEWERRQAQHPGWVVVDSATAEGGTDPWAVQRKAGPAMPEPTAQSAGDQKRQRMGAPAAPVAQPAEPQYPPAPWANEPPAVEADALAFKAPDESGHTFDAEGSDPAAYEPGYTPPSSPVSSPATATTDPDAYDPAWFQGPPAVNPVTGEPTGLAPLPGQAQTAPNPIAATGEVQTGPREDVPTEVPAGDALTPPLSPYAPGQAESMEPRPDRFDQAPVPTGRVQAMPGEPDYVPRRAPTVTGRAIDAVGRGATRTVAEMDDPGLAQVGANAAANFVRSLAGKPALPLEARPFLAAPDFLPAPVRDALSAAAQVGYATVSGIGAENIAAELWAEFGLPMIHVGSFEINPGMFLVPGRMQMGGMNTARRTLSRGAGEVTDAAARRAVVGPTLPNAPTATQRAIGQEATEYGTGLAGAIERAPGQAVRALGRGYRAAGGATPREALGELADLGRAGMAAGRALGDALPQPGPRALPQTQGVVPSGGGKWQAYSRDGDLIYEAATREDVVAWARRNAPSADIVGPARLPSPEQLSAPRQEIQPRTRPTAAEPPMDPRAPFPVAGAEVGGLRVRPDIPNTDSISAGFDEGTYTVLPGIRRVPIDGLGGDTRFANAAENARTARLAAAIRESGEVNPLIVVVDKDGPYVMEGGHRVRALYANGVREVPALVVIDESAEMGARTPPGSTQAVAPGTRVPGSAEAATLPRAAEVGARIASAELPATVGGSAAGAVSGGLAGAALTPEDATWDQRLENALAGASVGAVGAGAAARGTVRGIATVTPRSMLGAARTIDSMIARGALNADILSSHPDPARRVVALLALAAEGLPDSAVVPVPGLASALRTIDPRAAGRIDHLVSGQLTAGEVRQIARRSLGDRLREEVASLVADAVTGQAKSGAGRAARAAEGRADVAAVRGLPADQRAAPKPPDDWSGHPSVIDSPNAGRAEFSMDPRIVEPVNRVAREMGLPDDLAVYVSRDPRPNAEIHYDSGKPVVIVNEGLARAGLTPAEIEGVIRHELGHYGEHAAQIARGRGGARGAQGIVPSEGPQSWDEFSRSIRPEPRQPSPRPENDREIRERFGRPWEEVSTRIGKPTADLVTEGQNVKLPSMARDPREGVPGAVIDDVPRSVGPSRLNAIDPSGAALGGAAGAASGDEDGEGIDPYRVGAGMLMGAVGGGAGRRRLRSQAPGQQAIKASQAAEVARLRLDKFPEELRGPIRQAAEATGFAHDARRGVIPDQAAEDAADALGRTVDDWIGSSRIGRSLNTEETRALRNLVTGQAATVDDLARQIAEAEQAGVVTDLLIVQAHQEGQKLASLVSIMEGARAEAGRTLRAWRADPRPTDPAEAAQRIFNKFGGGPEGRQRALDALKEFQAIPPDNPIAQANFWARVERGGRITASDVLTAIRYNSMLSGPRTWEIGWVGSILQAPLKMASDVMAAATRPLSGELGEAARGALVGVQRGIRPLLETITHGITSEQALAGQLPRGLAPRATSPAGRVAGTLIDIPGRMVAAPDAFFTSVFSQMELGRQAAIAAYRKGLKGDARATFIRDFMDKPPKEAEAEVTRIVDGMMLRGDMGRFGRWAVGGISRDPLIASFVAPFMKVAYHSWTQGLDLTPVGAIGTAVDVARGAYRGGARPEGVRPLAERARYNAIGVGVTGAAVYQALQGNMTGIGPDDPEKRDQLRGTGWQPYSIKVGDRWISYANWGPVAVPLAAAAAYAENQQYKKPGAKPEDQMFDMAKRVAQLATEQSFLQGIGTVMNAFEDPKRYLPQLAAGNLTSMVPYGSMLNTIGQSQDDVVRRPDRASDAGILENVTQAVKGRTPINPLTPDRSDVPEALDPLGRPVPNQQQGAMAFQPFRISQERPDPVLQLFIDAKVDIPRPKDALTIDGIKIELTPEEQRQWQRFRGEQIERRADPLTRRESWGRAKPEVQTQYLADIIASSGDIADSKLRQAIGAAEVNRRKRAAQQQKRAS